MRALFASLLVLTSFSIAQIAQADNAPAASPVEQCDATGVEGIQFENTPLDYNVPCNTTILKGTQRNANKAFLMPQSSISINRSRELAFNLRPRSDGKWVLSLGVYFPRGQADLILREDLSDYYLNSCRQDEVQSHLNNPLNGYRTEKDRPIDLAYLPVRNIRIRIAGIPGYYDIVQSMHFLDREVDRAHCTNANILEYVGRDFLAEFILTEEQQKRFIERVTGIGVQVSAHFTFNARVSQGAVYGRIDLSSIAGSLDAAFSASGPAKMIGSAEFQAKLASLSSEVAMSLTTEGDLSQNQTATDLVNKITTQLFDLAQKVTRESSSSQGGAGSPSEGKINLKAVVEGFRQKQSIPIEYKTLGRNQDLTYVSTAIYQDRNLTVAGRRMQVSNLKSGVKVTSAFMAGQQITIQLVRKASQMIQFSETKKALSLEQIRALGVAEYFPTLKESMINKKSPLTTLGANPYWPSMTAILPEKSWTGGPVAQTMWFQVERVPIFEPRWTYVLSSMRMSDLGLALNFENGALYRIQDLVNGSSDLYNRLRVQLNEVDRSIVLTAKENMGMVQLHVYQDMFSADDLKSAARSQEYVPSSFVQQKFDLTGSPAVSIRDEFRPFEVPRAPQPMRAPRNLVAYEVNITGRTLPTRPNEPVGSGITSFRLNSGQNFESETESGAQSESPERALESAPAAAAAPVPTGSNPYSRRNGAKPSANDGVSFNPVLN